jgi:hypothetical protein
MTATFTTTIPVSVVEATAGILGTASLSAEQRQQLDTLGNQNGYFDVGDYLSRRVEALGLLERGQRRRVVACLELALRTKVRGTSGRRLQLGEGRQGLRALASARQRRGACEGHVVAIRGGRWQSEQQCGEHCERNHRAPKAHARRFPAIHRPANAVARSISVLGSGTAARNAIV